MSKDSFYYAVFDRDTGCQFDGAIFADENATALTIRWAAEGEGFFYDNFAVATMVRDLLLREKSINAFIRKYQLMSINEKG